RQPRSWFVISSRRRHTMFSRDWSSDVCSSDLPDPALATYRIKISNGNGNFDAVRFYNEYFVSPNLGTPILMNLLGDTDKLLEVQDRKSVVQGTCVVLGELCH